MGETSLDTYIEITPAGQLVVHCDLKRENADVIALGMLEKAKRAATTWIFRRQQAAKAAVTLAARQEKNAIDRLVRRNGT